MAKEYDPQFKIGDQKVFFSNIEATRAWLGVYSQLGVTMRRERVALAKQLDALDQRIDQNHQDVTMLSKDLTHYERAAAATD